MSFGMQIAGLSLLLFLGTIGMVEMGRRVRGRHREVDPDREMAGLGAFEGAVFTLLGLLLAFTFSGAAQRFDGRKELVAQEANAIGTAWLRLDLLSADDRSQMQRLFRTYLDARLESYHDGGDHQDATEAGARAMALQGDIWSAAVVACPKVPPPTCALLLPALNDMIDITTTRLVATWIHPPAVVYAMLMSLVLAAALLIGYATAANSERNWLHRVLFAAALTGSIFVTLDLEYPRAGLIRVDAVDALLVEVRRSFGE